MIQPCFTPVMESHRPNERTDMSDKLDKYRQDVRRTFQTMSDNALHFQNARIPWNDCIDRQEIDAEYARRADRATESDITIYGAGAV
jgi:phosphodiesterase/alkaline phosphatase D-like protein